METDYPNRDPFVHTPFDVHDFILQHLSTKDVKIASEVSQLWNKATGISLVSMSKLQLNPKLVDSELIIDEGSERRFVSLRWDSDKRDNEVEIQSNALKKLSVELREIEIVRIPEAMQMENLEFPKLKKLSISWYASERTLEKTMNSLKCSQLEHLELNTSGSDTIIAFLRQQLKLKHLTLSGGSQRIFSSDKVSSIQDLQLKSLNISDLPLWNMTTKQNLIEFLDTQSSTLTRLSIVTADHDLLKKVLTIPNIKCLEVSFNSVDEVHGLTENLAVKSVKISASVSNVRCILRRLPNLSELFIDSLYSGMLLAIAQSAPKLKQLYFISGNQIQEFYNEMKSNAGDWGIDSDFQLICVSRKFNKCC
jgi:hypothetical protein